MIKGIAFDKDGTLIDSERVMETAIETAAKVLNITLENGLFADIVGKSAEYSTSRLAAQTTNPQAFFTEISHQRDLITNGQMPFIAGVVDMLCEISQKFPIALVTSDNRESALKDLQEYAALFQAIITANDVQKVKPDPEPYLLAAKKLNIAPHEMLVFEDSDVGAAAGRAAGAIVLQIGKEIQSVTDIWRFL